MSDYIKDPSLEDFINQFTDELNKLNKKNLENISELNDRNDIPVKQVLTGVYNDFFGTRGSSGLSNTAAGSRESNAKSTAHDSKTVSDLSVDEIIADLKKEEEKMEHLGSLPNISENTENLSASGGCENAGRPESENAGQTEGENTVRTEAENNIQAAEEKEPEKSGMEQLNELTGLKNIKHDVAELVALAKVRKLREEKGLKFVPTSLHLVFSGNPGTGKTTVARILAKLYKEIGILSKGQLVEVDRSALVAGYVGQTAIKTQEKIKEAMGGILFVDEAYTLVRNEGNDFGQEAIDTILKAMEDHRDNFIVIVAGYTDLMKDFIDSNPGLKSRFNKYIYFEDYTAEELCGIFDSNCKKYSYTLTPEAKIAVDTKIAELVAKKDENFANAREVRNLFEEIITNQAARVSLIEAPTEEDLMTVLPEDLEDNVDFGVKKKESGCENESDNIPGTDSSECIDVSDNSPENDSSECIGVSDNSPENDTSE